MGRRVNKRNSRMEKKLSAANNGRRMRLAAMDVLQLTGTERGGHVEWMVVARVTEEKRLKTAALAHELKRRGYEISPINAGGG